MSLIIVCNPIYAEANKPEDIVVSLGKDLTNDQRNQILNLFGVKDDIRIIEVTNAEERKYLGKYVEDKVIGTRSLSCAYVENLKDGSGITVETYNITWVTKEMFENALVTAGIRDARVKVAAPINVSGTAALTGIIKAFEGATGINISEAEKDAANEELARTGKLGEEIGKEKATELIREIKREIVERNLKNENQIREVVIRIAGELNINLNKQQTDEIVGLMRKISNLNLNIQDIEGQLRGITNRVREIAKDNQEVRSILQQIIDLFRRLFSSIFGWIGN